MHLDLQSKLISLATCKCKSPVLVDTYTILTLRRNWGLAANKIPPMKTSTLLTITNFLKKYIMILHFISTKDFFFFPWSILWWNWISYKLQFCLCLGSAHLFFGLAHLFVGLVLLSTGSCLTRLSRNQSLFPGHYMQCMQSITVMVYYGMSYFENLFESPVKSKLLHFLPAK